MYACGHTMGEEHVVHARWCNRLSTHVQCCRGATAEGLRYRPESLVVADDEFCICHLGLLHRREGRYSWLALHSPPPCCSQARYFSHSNLYPGPGHVLAGLIHQTPGRFFHLIRHQHAHSKCCSPRCQEAQGLLSRPWMSWVFISRSVLGNPGALHAHRCAIPVLGRPHGRGKAADAAFPQSRHQRAACFAKAFRQLSVVHFR
jgi:hypothetical protein